ncbi:glycine cleavage system protein H [Aerococcus viridans]|uniref:glycine cleavage system protein H n=1 Tax=Aerococcus TaxID=1375 RepID=UPI003AA8327C
MRKLANYLWVEQNGDEFTFIMTPELQDDIGTVGYVEFITKEGDQVEENQAILNLEASKTVLELQAPLAGTITAINKATEDAPEQLNSEKADESWVCKMTNVDQDAYDKLPEA